MGGVVSLQQVWEQSHGSWGIALRYARNLRRRKRNPVNRKSMKTQMNSKLLILVLFLLACLTADGGVSAAPSEEAEVRSSVQRIFVQLKAGQYEALYDSLPSSPRSL